MTDEPAVMTIDEVSDLLRVHRCTLYRMLKRRKFPGFKIGTDWRFNREHIENWMKIQATTGGTKGLKAKNDAH